MSDNPYLLRARFLRRRFAENGLDGMPPEESLELLLGYIADPKSIPELKEALLLRFGSVSGILNAPYRDLLEVPGMSEAAAFFISNIPAVHSVVCSSRVPDEKMTPEVAKRYFEDAMSGLPFEQARVAFLGDDLSFIRCETAASGDSVSVRLNFSKIIAAAQSCRSSKVILCHNHPDSSSKPSPADFNLTRRLQSQLSRAGIDLICHIVVGVDGVSEVVG